MEGFAILSGQFTETLRKWAHIRPHIASDPPPEDFPVTWISLTFLQGGGMAVTLSIHHIVCDAAVKYRVSSSLSLSLSHFLSSNTESNRCNENTLPFHGMQTMARPAPGFFTSPILAPARDHG